MCQLKPGPRCSAHAREKLSRERAVLDAAVRREAEARAARRAGGSVEDDDVTRLALVTAKQRVSVVQAQTVYDSTPEGQQRLGEAAAAAMTDGDAPTMFDAQSRLRAGVLLRERQVRDAATVRAFRNVVGAQFGLDRDQCESLWKTSLARVRDVDVEAARDVDWEGLIDGVIDGLATDERVSRQRFDAISRDLWQARAQRLDPDMVAGVVKMRERASKAVRALRRQVHAAAAYRGVAPGEAWRKFKAYRRQYQSVFAGLPASERPDPPPEWVAGFGGKDLMSVSSPQDPATLYAVYRMQADPGAFPRDPRVRYASIDLETANGVTDSGRVDSNPGHGGIIEVGIVEYDCDGRETGRYSQLVNPGADVLARLGTGAVEVHGITVEDVQGMPSWEVVAGEVADRLAGRVMIAQNARFEQAWLTHHVRAAGREFDYYRPLVDTLSVARQHMPNLSNHKLATICGAVGVAYTDGHRATHDAEVAANAFFAMRDRIEAGWGASGARAAAPQPRTDGVGSGSAGGAGSGRVGGSASAAVAA